MKKTTGRSRNFSLISYLDQTQLNLVLASHINQIKTYAYAYHDKDIKEDGELKEPHFHIILCLYNANSVSAVRRWFSGFVDKDGNEINTLGQVCSDIFAQYDYLTHNTAQCIADGKYQYDKEIVVCDNKSYFRADDEYSADNLTLALTDYLNGVTLKTLYKKYGRDFIIHYQGIKQLAFDIKNEESLFE